ncbi:expressed unknown protein [Seminavis robusta]|uniref:Helicase-associated domain-containing protein n=1 Tax=Seminavis robusta TaxID=568900 RepID=A0A9N8HG99_9STRA|nr:expressed unknown protein [Seminavis robusta]|eukprot:Sro621_g176730.1 n/a (239) ;mRNA; f:18698-19414
MSNTEGGSKHQKHLSHKERWELKLQELKEFKAIDGNCRVSRRTHGKEDRWKELAVWVQNVRVRYNKRQLSPDQRKDLESVSEDREWLIPKFRSPSEIPVSKEHHHKKWNAKFEQLGYCPSKQHTETALFQSDTRTIQNGDAGYSRKDKYKKGTLDPTRKGRLADIGFVWDVKTWNKKEGCAVRKWVKNCRVDAKSAGILPNVWEGDEDKEPPTFTKFLGNLVTLAKASFQAPEFVSDS